MVSSLCRNKFLKFLNNGMSPIPVMTASVSSSSIVVDDVIEYGK